jgi:hypothetical protein
LGDHKVPFAYRLRADAHVRHTVDGHEAIGTFPCGAKQPAWPMVFEAAGKDLDARGRESRTDGFAGEGSESLSLKLESEAAGAIDQFTWVRVASGHVGSVIRTGRRSVHASTNSGFEFLGPEAGVNFVGVGVALRQKPLLATLAVIPPFYLNALTVGAEIEVPGPMLFRRAGRRTGMVLAPEVEFIY